VYDVAKPERFKGFSFNDFVGEMVATIGSRVRAAASAHAFEQFHQRSAEIIRDACFGSGGKYLEFPNDLRVTAVDVQSVDPIDERTRESLQKGVQMAIEISTRTQEANARHKSESDEQRAKAALEKQELADKAQAEEAKVRLLELQAESRAVESSGQATAEAAARAEAEDIAARSALEQAKLRAEAEEVEFKAEMEMVAARNKVEVDRLHRLAELEIMKASRMAEIEVKAAEEKIRAVGMQNLLGIAAGGKNVSLRLVRGMGVKKITMLSDGAQVNLFNGATANPPALTGP
jgi:major vault protein